MSYTAPSPSSIDLTAYNASYVAPAPSSIDLSTTATADPEGAVSAPLGFVASFSGYMQPIGEIDSQLSFTAILTSPGSAVGSFDSALGFTASFVGETANQYGDFAASLSFGFSGSGFQDWTAALDPVQLQEFYTLEISGSPNLTVKISSWQATMNIGGRSSYLQATIPAAAELIEEIESRQNGNLTLKKGFRFSDGSERSEPILETDFDTFRYDRGATNFTVTVSGYIPGAQSQTGSRALNQIRSISLTNGQYRVRCAIDMFLRPGMTAQVLGESFKVGTINFYASNVDRFCEVSE